jgi:uncharacterized membrane protein
MKIEIGFKYFLYQIIGVLIIWLGMTYFLDDIFGVGKIIYYVVTSWLLFLIVIMIRTFIETRKKKHDE